MNTNQNLIENQIFYQVENQIGEQFKNPKKVEFST